MNRPNPGFHALPTVVSPTVTTKSLLIPATAGDVWEALTNSKFTEHRLLHYHVQSDWRIGSTITWKCYDSFETGTLVSSIRCKHLKYSVGEPDATNYSPDEPAFITYDLRDRGDVTELIVTIERTSDDPFQAELISASWEKLFYMQLNLL